MKLVTISGIDKSGKTTILNALNAATNHRHFVIERDPTSVMEFATMNPQQRLFNCKGTSYHKYIKDYGSLLFHYRSLPLIAVFLYAPASVIEQRFKDHNEPPLINNIAIKMHQFNLMKRWQDAYWRYPLMFNTHTRSIDDIVNEIIKTIEEE